jgi:formylglycine-generating enzyme required for sulfatase activity
MECSTETPSRFASFKNDITINASKYVSKKGMILIDGGTIMMSADDESASPDEYPKHKVTVDAFWIDAAEVTNAQFAEFVKETNYITTAEQIPDWEEMKKQLPPGAPKPDNSLFVAASLVFNPPDQKVNLTDYSQWWLWQKGADWKHPHGRDDYNSLMINKSFVFFIVILSLIKTMFHQTNTSFFENIYGKS